MFPFSFFLPSALYYLFISSFQEKKRFSHLINSQLLTLEDVICTDFRQSLAGRTLFFSLSKLGGYYFPGNGELGTSENDKYYIKIPDACRAACLV